MDTMYLKDPLVLFGFEGSALSLPLFLLLHALSLFFNNGKGPLYRKSNLMALNGLLCRCAFKPSFNQPVWCNHCCIYHLPHTGEILCKTQWQICSYNCFWRRHLQLSIHELQLSAVRWELQFHLLQGLASHQSSPIHSVISASGGSNWSAAFQIIACRLAHLRWWERLLSVNLCVPISGAPFHPFHGPRVFTLIVRMIESRPSTRCKG